jgi:hypothetical protein
MSQSRDGEADDRANIITDKAATGSNPSGEPTGGNIHSQGTTGNIEPNCSNLELATRALIPLSVIVKAICGLIFVPFWTIGLST